MKVLHISLTARHADALARFYREAFGFFDRRPPKRLSGDIVSRGNGLPESNIYSIALNPPGGKGPFLEIMEYDKAFERQMPTVHEPGFSHLALGVIDLQASIGRVLRSGGSMQGKVTNFGTKDRPYLIVYVRDPEGNILELEQSDRQQDRP